MNVIFFISKIGMLLLAKFVAGNKKTDTHYGERQNMKKLQLKHN